MAKNTFGKALLKTLLGVSLASVPFVAFMFGAHTFMAGYDGVKEGKSDKAEIIENYEGSDEYQENQDKPIQVEEGFLEEVFVSAEAKEDKKTEQIIINYGNEQAVKELNSVNEAIEMFEQKAMSGLIMVLSSLVLCFPAHSLSGKVFEAIESKPEDYIDHEYDNKPIIM